MTQTPQEQQAHLAARLLYLVQQEKAISQEKSEVKEALEALHANNLISTKEDVPTLFSDGSTRTIRLQRKNGGSYFKVGAEFKDEFSGETSKLQAKYLKAGKAEMAEKAASWVAQEVKA